MICTLTEGSNCTEDQAEGQKTQFFHVLSSKAAVCFTLHQHRLIFFYFLIKQRRKTRTRSSLRFMHFESNPEEGRAGGMKAKSKAAGM